jgi:plasmid maintenance system antidote protein VapI
MRKYTLNGPLWRILAHGLGLSLKQTADKLGINEDCFYNAINGRNRVSDEIIKRFLEIWN